MKERKQDQKAAMKEDKAAAKEARQDDKVADRHHDEQGAAAAVTAAGAGGPGAYEYGQDRGADPAAHTTQAPNPAYAAPATQAAGSPVYAAQAAHPGQATTAAAAAAGGDPYAHPSAAERRALEHENKAGPAAQRRAEGADDEHGEGKRGGLLGLFQRHKDHAEDGDARAGSGEPAAALDQTSYTYAGQQHAAQAPAAQTHAGPTYAARTEDMPGSEAHEARHRLHKVRSSAIQHHSGC